MLAAVSARRKKKIRPKTQGVILWEGPSPENGDPIFIVLTGLHNPSKNPKTGPMLQTFVLCRDVSPEVAVQTGDMVAVCNGCPLSPYLVKQKYEAENLPKGHRPPICYVTAHRSLLNVWRAYHRGRYPRVRRRDIPRLVRGRSVRLGSYGNMSNSPAWLVPLIAEHARNYTCYDHNWRAPHAQYLKDYAMASVSSEEEMFEAKRLGWRTFRIVRSQDEILPSERLCPASYEAGKRTTCERCLLCRGNAIKTRDISIFDHGATSSGHTARVQAARLQVGLGRLKGEKNG